jgi:outer membrane protein TolC
MGGYQGLGTASRCRAPRVSPLNVSPGPCVNPLMISTRSVLALLCLSAAALPAQTPDTLRLTLAQTVERMLRTSDEARIALAQVDLADAQVTAARAAGMPQLRLASTYQQQVENARALIVGNVFGQSYTYNTNLLLQQSLFQGGRIVGANQAAARSERAARATSEETRITLAVDAQRIYLGVALAAQLADIQRRNLEIADTRLAQAEQLERTGRASRYDVLRARVERTNLEPTALQAENARVLAELEFKRLLQVPVAQPIALSTVLDPTAVQAMAAAALADDQAPGVRPGVRAAELTASAREAAIRVARADLLPTLNASFQLGYLALPAFNGLPTKMGESSLAFCANPGTATRPCQNNGWFPDRTFNVQFTWPLFDGLRAKGAIDVAQAQARVADLQVRQAREQASIDVERARAELVRAQATFTARAGNVREAAEAFDLATMRFGRGIGTQLEVSDAQLALLIARSTEARATFDLYVAVADLARVRARPIPLPDGGTVALGPNR